ncbi:MAG: hypothetical protein GF317_17235 [Candidatus Lokiarchaeota archaeon]|nr:hypothetical protein [Candidatus Lokiarchaeota archaeon]MBD3201257.1 hypothetical protein [Candidatus Lokiarchaeota archaeon]
MTCRVSKQHNVFSFISLWEFEISNAFTNSLIFFSMVFSETSKKLPISKRLISECSKLKIAVIYAAIDLSSALFRKTHILLSSERFSSLFKTRDAFEKKVFGRLYLIWKREIHDNIYSTLCFLDIVGIILCSYNRLRARLRF